MFANMLGWTSFSILLEKWSSRWSSKDNNSSINAASHQEGQTWTGQEERGAETGVAATGKCKCVGDIVQTQGTQPSPQSVIFQVPWNSPGFRWMEAKQVARRPLHHQQFQFGKPLSPIKLFCRHILKFCFVSIHPVPFFLFVGWWSTATNIYLIAPSMSLHA